jgi:DNA polymerase
MEKDPDINKVVRQHLQMDEFFTGGFGVKGQKTMSDQAEHKESTINSSAELEKLADKVCRCRECDLGYSRTNAVPGECNPNARIMFIGEAPGADEAAQVSGIPYVMDAYREEAEKIINV